MNPIIFIVEDDHSLVESLRRLLAFAGFAVEDFTDPEAFWLRLHQQLPALILLDIYIGAMDGRLLCQVLKRQPATQSIPIILMTGSVNAPDAAQYGADQILTKPFAVTELIDLVRRLARGRKSDASDVSRLPRVSP